MAESKTGILRERNAIWIQLCICGVLTFITCSYYGLRPLIVVLGSILVSVITDAVCMALQKKKAVAYDWTAVLSGAVLGLMMPVSVPYPVLVAANMAAVILAKQIFGGHGHYFFNIPAVGFLFASLCWPDAVLLYPKVETVDLASQVSNSLSTSLTQGLNIATIPAVSNFDIMLGKFMGPMGSTHIIILLVAAIVLMGSRSISALAVLPGFFTILFAGYCWPVYGSTRMDSLAYELISGMMVFGLLFLAGDRTTAPRTRAAKLLYSFLIGVLTLIFRRLGGVENAVVFAVLISNPIGLALDRQMLAIGSMIRSFHKGTEKDRAERIRQKALEVEREAEALARELAASPKPAGSVMVAIPHKRKYSGLQRVWFFIKRYFHSFSNKRREGVQDSEMQQGAIAENSGTHEDGGEDT